jgi:hypothetical protein
LPAALGGATGASVSGRGIGLRGRRLRRVAALSRGRRAFAGPAGRQG